MRLSPRENEKAPRPAPKARGGQGIWLCHSDARQVSDLPEGHTRIYRSTTEGQVEDPQGKKIG